MTGFETDFQTDFLPTFVHVTFVEFRLLISPIFLHASPTFIAALAGVVTSKKEPRSVKTRNFFIQQQ